MKTNMDRKFEQAMQQPTHERATLKPKEAADIFGVSLPTFYNYVHQEGFPAAIWVGRKLLIHKDRFYQWLDELAG